MKSRVGKWVGKYTVIRELGHGGTGVVYLALDRELERQVALKRLHPELTQDPRHVAHFRQEAKVLAGIRHLHVVPVHAQFEYDGALYIDMAYIEGPSLREVLFNDLLGFDEAIEIVRQLLSALVACHGAGIIHCDVKPSNVLIDEAGRAHLVDFGWASALRGSVSTLEGSPSIRDTHFVGTLNYAPPEGWVEKRPSPSWDLYSVGVVACEMLLGTPPEPGQNLTSLLTLDPRFSTDFGEWLQKMIAVRPLDRYLSAEDALRALTACTVAREAAVARSDAEETLVRSRRTARANGWGLKRILTTRAIAALCILVGAGWYFSDGKLESSPLAENAMVSPVAMTALEKTNAEAPHLADVVLPLSGSPDSIVVSGSTIFFSASMDGVSQSVMSYSEEEGLSTVLPASVVGEGAITIYPVPGQIGRVALRLQRAEKATQIWLSRPGELAEALTLPDLDENTVVIVTDYQSSLLISTFQIRTGKYHFHVSDGTTENIRSIGGNAEELGIFGSGLDEIVSSDGTPFVLTGNVGGELWRFKGCRDDSWVLDIASGDKTLAIRPWNDMVYATIDSPDFGGELWRSDGTAGGTYRVLDLRPGPDSAFTFDRDPGLRAVGSWLVFGARTDAIGLELWRTDGTKEGTGLVVDIAPGTLDSNPYQWTLFQGQLYFTAFTKAYGRELWVTDGTPEGTRIVADIWPGYKSGEPYSLCPSPAGLFFSADDGIHGEELWLLPNPGASPRLVTDLYPGGPGSEPYKSKVFNGGVVFTATHPDYGRELFYSDGTATGTRLLVDIAPDGQETPSISVAPWAPVSTRLCAMDSPESGVELGLYVEGGTVPTLLLDIVPGPEGSFPMDFVEVGGYAYFSADDHHAGRELWRTDYTPEGTHLVADVNFRELSGNPRQIMCIGEDIYFVADCQRKGTELWRLNVSNRSASALECAPGSKSSKPCEFRRAGNLLIFNGVDESGRFSEWEVKHDMEQPINRGKVPAAGEGFG